VRIDARDGAAIKDVAVARITPVAWRQISNRGQNKRKRGKDARRPACSFLFSRTEPAQRCWHHESAPLDRGVASIVGATRMNATRYLPFAGRLLIGLPFLVSGLSKLAAYGATIDFIMSSSLPLPPPLAYAGSVTVELGCGVLMIAGYQARVVAGVLALFCLATAVFFHTNFADPNQTFHFIKNLIMTGGLLQVVAFGAGAVSIDNRVSKGRARADNVALAS